MVLRLTTPSDRDLLSATTQSLYPEDYWDGLQFNRVFAKHPSWICEDNGKIAAALISEIYKGAPYIWSVATDPSYRGKGLATALIKEFEKHYESQGYDKTWLHVRVENPAQKLYFDLGYRVASFEPNLYGPHTHGLVMRKKFVATLSS